MTLICISNFSNNPPPPTPTTTPPNRRRSRSFTLRVRQSCIYFCLFFFFAAFIQNSSFTVRRRTRKPCHRGNGSCLPFTTILKEIRLEGKWYTTFWVFPTENFREQRNIWKGSPVFPDGMFQKEIRVPFLQSYLWYQFQAFAAVFR